MGQKLEIDVGCEFMGGPDSVEAIFEAIKGRGRDNRRGELVPARSIDHSVGEALMSGSCHTIPLLELELVTSVHRVVMSWQQILIYAIVSVHILVDVLSCHPELVYS